MRGILRGRLTDMEDLIHLEDRKHGSDDFPIALYHVTPTHPRYVMICHWHKEFEIVRVNKGSLDMRIGDREVSLSAGQCAIIHGGVLHSGEPHDCEYDCAVFDDSVVSSAILCRAEMKKLTSEKNDISGVYDSHDGLVGSALASLFGLSEKDGKPSGLAFTACLARVFALISEYELFRRGTENSESKNENKYMKHLKKVIAYIEENYGGQIKLSDLALAAGLSPKYFCRVFRRVTGKTPTEYLAFFRIEKACEMIAEKDMPVIDAAMRCGFDDVSYFIKVFRKYKGVTPGKYALQQKSK